MFLFFSFVPLVRSLNLSYLSLVPSIRGISSPLISFHLASSHLSLHPLISYRSMSSHKISCHSISCNFISCHVFFVLISSYVTASQIMRSLLFSSRFMSSHSPSPFPFPLPLISVDDTHEAKIACEPSRRPHITVLKIFFGLLYTCSREHVWLTLKIRQHPSRVHSCMVASTKNP